MGRYEYHQLVENRWVDGKSRQKVLLYFGRYSTVETALEVWPKERGGETLRWEAATKGGAPFKRLLLRENSGIRFEEGTQSRNPSRQDCGEAEETSAARGAGQDTKFKGYSA